MPRSDAWALQYDIAAAVAAENDVVTCQRQGRARLRAGQYAQFQYWRVKNRRMHLPLQKIIEPIPVGSNDDGKKEDWIVSAAAGTAYGITRKKSEKK